MKREKLVTCLWATALAFGLSFGAVACMVTAFDMEISLAAAAGILALAAAVCAVCFSLPLGAVPLGMGALALWQLWYKGVLAAAAEAILNRLSRQYYRAYGWAVIRWTVRTAPEMEPDLLPALCILGAIVAMCTAWSVCRGKTAVPGVLLSVAMLAACVVVTDTVPDAIWLYLYLLSLCVLLVTGATRHRSANDANRLSTIAAPVAAMALLLVFLLNPVQKYKGADLAEDLTDALRQFPTIDTFLNYMGLEQTETTVQLENGVDLTAVGRRNNYGAKVMEIQITGTGTSTVYLRSMAYDFYDGKSWTSSGNTMIGLDWPKGLPGNETVQIETRYAHQMLYTPYYVQSVNLNGTVTGIENQSKLTEYSFSYSPIPNKQYFLTRYPNVNTGMDAEERGNMLLGIQMDDSVRRWAQTLLRRDRVQAGPKNDYHMAQAIGDYVRSSATYDLSTDRMPKREKDFARWFLEDSDTGYCVHFATAATVLLQAAKIPARYVTGYMVQAEAGVPTDITADMAHAWAEYYLPGFGWTILEATPGGFTEQPEQTEPEQETDASEPEQTVPEDATTAATQPDSQQPVEEEKQLPWEMLWILLVLILMVIAAEGQCRLRRSMYRKKYAQATENEKAILCWQQLVRLARLAGITPEKRFYALAQKAAFSQYVLTGKELQQMETAVENSRKALQRKPLYRRLFYRLVYAI